MRPGSTCHLKNRVSGHTRQILRLDAMRRTMIARTNTMVRFIVLRILINIVLLWSMSDIDN